jgi:nucleotide-binding universal stress UspA family protein
MHETSGRARVVVGVDGSGPSVFAVRWAADQARLRGAQLCAVIVEGIPAPPYGPNAPAVAAGPVGDCQATARATLMDSIATALGSKPNMAVHEHVEQGNPADVLGCYSEDAELLVLGSHRGEGAELGPTILGCIRTCSCPLAVITEGAAVIELASAGSPGWPRTAPVWSGPRWRWCRHTGHIHSEAPSLVPAGAATTSLSR